MHALSSARGTNQATKTNQLRKAFKWGYLDIGRVGGGGQGGSGTHDTISR